MDELDSRRQHQDARTFVAQCLSRQQAEHRAQALTAAHHDVTRDLSYRRYVALEILLDFDFDGGEGVSQLEGKDFERVAVGRLDGFAGWVDTGRHAVKLAK